MRRDLDLQRKLMFQIEACDSLDGLPFFAKRFAASLGLTSEDLDDCEDLDTSTEYNLGLLEDVGLVKSEWLGQYRCYHISSAGHDYLDAIRSEGIWAQTKAAVAETGGSASLEIIKQLAIGFTKKQLSKHTGIDF